MDVEGSSGGWAVVGVFFGANDKVLRLLSVPTKTEIPAVVAISSQVNSLRYDLVASAGSSGTTSVPSRGYSQIR